MGPGPSSSPPIPSTPEPLPGTPSSSQGGPGLVAGGWTLTPHWGQEGKASDRNRPDAEAGGHLPLWAASWCPAAGH